MRLASKIFLTSTLVIAVLAGVGALSLRAVDRLVTVNREITTVTVPALRLAASVREAIAALTRLEARTLVLSDGRYEKAWNERAGLVARDLARLRYYATRGAAEIGQLARSFNLMAAQLRQMEETKDEFFAKFSHELRSPLTSIRGATDLLRDGVPGPLTEKQTRLVEIIGGSSDRLLQLVNQILEISRLRAGLVPLDRAWVELDRLVAHAVEELHPRAEAAGVRLERDLIGTDFRCHGDEGRLLQVVVNPAGNALRFTPKGGRVVVRLVDADPEL